MYTLAAPCRYEEVIRRSRFIAHAAPVRSQAESLDFHQSVADPQATHNCWAWRIDLLYRFNDDGEPSSSAGRPILSAIEGRELDQVMIVVTRYFGGTKLGIGGLVRAYGGVAAKCLDRADITDIISLIDCRLSADFSLAGSLHQLLDRFRAEKTAESYDGAGLTMQLRLAKSHLPAFRRALAEISRGEAVIERL